VSPKFPESVGQPLALFDERVSQGHSLLLELMGHLGKTDFSLALVPAMFLEVAVPSKEHDGGD